MIDKIKKLLSTGDDVPSSADVREELGRVSNSLKETRDELDRLERGRDDLLVFGSTEEIQAHDERVGTMKTQVEQLEARQERLRRRRRELESAEAVTALPTLIEEVRAAADALQELDAARQSALRDLEAAVARFSSAKATVSMHRPNAVADLPTMPEELARRIREMHRPSVRVMRS